MHITSTIGQHRTTMNHIKPAGITLNTIRNREAQIYLQHITTQLR